MPALGSQRRLLGSLNCTPPATLPLTPAPNRTGPQCLEVSIPDGLFLSLGLVSLVENVLVVAAIAKNRNLHSPMYYLICCLAVSDLLVSVSNVLETAVMLLLEAGVLATQAAVVQQLDNVIDVLICSSMVSSLCFLGAIAVDRYTYSKIVWMKAQHEGALTPPCIVRKRPQVTHTAQHLCVALLTVLPVS